MEFKWIWKSEAALTQIYSYHEKDVVKTQNKKWSKKELTLMKKIIKNAMTQKYYNFVMLMLRLLSLEEDLAVILDYTACVFVELEET